MLWKLSTFPDHFYWRGLEAPVEDWTTRGSTQVEVHRLNSSWVFAFWEDHSIKENVLVIWRPMIIHVVERRIEVPFHFFESPVFIEKKSYKFLELHFCCIILLWATQFLLDLPRQPILKSNVSLTLRFGEGIHLQCHLLVGNQCLGQILEQRTCKLKPTCP